MSARPSLLGLCAVALSLLVPAGARAAVASVNMAGAPTDAKVQQVIATGAKQARLFLPWNALEPAGRGTYGDGSAAAAQNDYDTAVRTLNASGVEPIFTVTFAPKWASGSDAAFAPPRDPGDYASFVAGFAEHMTRAGLRVAAYEVWNEPDADVFWQTAGGPDAAAYTALARATYAAAKPKTSAAIILGATAGNDYPWVESLYDHGIQGSFDGVATHTDTPCLDARPDQFYRDSTLGDRIGPYTFLGYREIRATMLAHGDDKPIWMTELGWSSTNGKAGSCTRGNPTADSVSGVSQTEQASYLTEAYGCLANDPYVVSAGWFTLLDDPAGSFDEVQHYGLLDKSGAKKPAWTAFHAVAEANGGAPIACGDFDPPSLTVTSPVEGQQYVDKLDLMASARDAGVGLSRIRYTYDGGKAIATFGTLEAGQAKGFSPWNGSGALALGPHTIEVTARDTNGNETTRQIHVVKVAPGTLKATLASKFKLPGKVTCKKGSCTLKGRFQRLPGQASPTGKVAVEWQYKSKGRGYRKLGGGLKPAGRTFVFRLSSKYRGRWRVRVIYQGVAPYQKVTSKFISFRFR